MATHHPRPNPWPKCRSCRLLQSHRIDHYRSRHPRKIDNPQAGIDVNGENDKESTKARIGGEPNKSTVQYSNPPNLGQTHHQSSAALGFCKITTLVVTGCSMPGMGIGAEIPSTKLARVLQNAHTTDYPRVILLSTHALQNVWLHRRRLCSKFNWKDGWKREGRHYIQSQRLTLRLIHTVGLLGSTVTPDLHALPHIDLAHTPNTRIFLLKNIK
jgi:hypothetical protein